MCSKVNWNVITVCNKPIANHGRQLIAARQLVGNPFECAYNVHSQYPWRFERGTEKLQRFASKQCTSITDMTCFGCVLIRYTSTVSPLILIIRVSQTSIFHKDNTALYNPNILSNWTIWGPFSCLTKTCFVNVPTYTRIKHVSVIRSPEPDNNKQT